MTTQSAHAQSLRSSRCRCRGIIVAWFTPLLLFGTLSVLYYQGLGDYGLFDPWETHYGEVARDMVERGNYIDTFWGAPWDSGDVKRERAGFYSKPPLTMWMMAAGMNLMGFNAWGVRLFFPFIALFALLSVYLTLTRLKGRVVAVCATLCTALIPSFTFMSHQAVTDGPLVNLVIMAMMSLILAISVDAEDQASVTLRFVISGLILAVIVAQLWIIWPMDRSPDALRPSPDPAWGARIVWWFNELWIVGRGKGWVIALTLFPLIGVFMREVTSIKGTRDLYFLAFYLFCGLTVAAKGWLGWAPMGGALLCYLLISGSWHLITGYRVIIGLLTVFFTGHIWVLAMLGGHHPDWMKRFIYHDHINRLFKGVHSTDSGHFEYFFQWTAYGLYPLIALIPLALGYAFSRWRSQPHLTSLFFRTPLASLNSSQPTTDTVEVIPELTSQLTPELINNSSSKNSEHRSSTKPLERTALDPLVLMLTLWSLIGFTLFSYSSTKFHHYIFPVLPALTILIGLTLAQIWRGRLRVPRWASITAIATLLWVGTDLMIPAENPGQGAQHWVNLFTYKYDRKWPLKKTPQEIADLEERVASRAWRETFTLPATRSALAAQDSELKRAYLDEVWSQTHLTNPVRMWTFIALLGLLFLISSHLSIRRSGVTLILAATLWAAIFSLHVYLPAIATHWSQWELWQSYYERCETYSKRESEEFKTHLLNFSSRVPRQLDHLPTWCRDPVIAFRMNWRGEAFYTHNTVVPVLYTKDLKPILENWGVWDKWQPRKRFFIFTERSRIKSELERSLPQHLKGQYREVFGEGRRFVLLEVDLDQQESKSAQD